MLKFKLIILGDSGVGKTSFMDNFMGKPFNMNNIPTIGVEFDSQEFLIDDIFRPELCQRIRACPVYNLDRYAFDKDKLKLHVWNSAGQERFHSIVTSYFRGSQGVILMLDLTRPNTLSGVKKWIDDFNKHHPVGVPGIPAVMVANKADLNLHREITNEELQNFAKQYDLPYFVVSSKCDSNKVKDVFVEMARQMTEAYLADPEVADMSEIIKLQRNKKRLTRFRCC